MISPRRIIAKRFIELREALRRLAAGFQEAARRPPEGSIRP